ncbi:hypothetical protein [Calothrix sp. UHCC 0171]|uniref:hypothetical protein n=1 Tax=Calothrix sp. UHCC 0171 TaxID=3110245 RepID=UPI002B21FED1|nr:hypothetical protein [Calothrix sp. UHCC 0171]MEA5574528.1 hypothetical protein [Calothrix sp. UHCC 0171]
MLTQELLLQKFTTVLKQRCPQLSSLLQYCHIELVNHHWGQPPKVSLHFVVYSPNNLFTEVSTYKPIFREVANNLGIPEAICMNATRIISDRASTLKERNLVLWLELQWIVTQHLE